MVLPSFNNCVFALRLDSRDDDTNPIVAIDRSLNWVATVRHDTPNSSMLVPLDLVVIDDEAITTLALVKTRDQSSHHNDLDDGTIIVMPRD